MTWKEALQITRVRWVIFFCVSTLLINVFYTPFFYQEVLSPKKGFSLNDPFLNLFAPVDWSLPIFTILYLAVLHAVLSTMTKPNVALLGLATYCVVNLFRIVTMYVITLEPPVGIILLVDPISSITYPGKDFAKDLFFSGHISAMMALVFIEKNQLAKILKIVGTVIMGVLLAWQHVHYTIDLLAAPIITYGAFLLIQAALKLGDEARQPTKEEKTRLRT